MANEKDNGEYHAKQPQYGKVPAELMHNPAIKDGTVRLYAHMQWRYGRKRLNYEGQKSMADYLGVSRPAIITRLKELEYFDWLVTIQRDPNPKTGEYRTPYYHLFESQEECRQFRETYQLQAGEIMRDKSAENEIALRKSRKGKGGKPENLRHTKVLPTPATVSTQVDMAVSTQVNTVRVNSGLHESVESYPVPLTYPVKEKKILHPADAEPDFDIPWQPLKVKRVQISEGSLATYTPTPRKERPRDLVFDAIAEAVFDIHDTKVLSGNDGGRIGALAKVAREAFQLCIGRDNEVMLARVIRYQGREVKANGYQLNRAKDAYSLNFKGFIQQHEPWIRRELVKLDTPPEPEPESNAPLISSEERAAFLAELAAFKFGSASA